MAEKITKKEAVRRALTELGNDAMPVAIQGWVKDKLGVEMTAGHVSTTKGELLRKPVAPAESLTVVVVEPLTPAGEKITKNEAVRRALTELGKKADRVQIQGFVKDRFGIEMGLDHISTAKADALRKLKADKKKAKAAKTPAITPEPVPAKPVPATTNGESIALEDVFALKALMNQIGPVHLRTLIDVMAK